MQARLFTAIAGALCLVAACEDVETPADGGGGAGGDPLPPPPIWSRAWGGDEGAEYIPNTIAFTAEGHVIVAGFWWRGAQPFDLGCGDLGATYEDGYDMFVARLDESGACVWSRSFGTHIEGAGSDTIHDLAVDPNGDVVFTGSLGGDLDFAPEAAGGELEFRGIASAEVVKLDGDSGDHLWSIAFSGEAATVTGNGIATDGEGHVLVTGRVYNTAEFGSFELSPVDGNDAFIVKLDRDSGQPIWATSLSYGGNDQGSAIAVDDNDDVLVGGTADAGGDLFVAKLAGASGEKLWDHWWIAEGEGDQAYFSRIAVTPDQDVIVSATFDGTIHPGTTTLVSQANDGFVARLYGSHGLLRWVRQVGGVGNDSVHGLAVDASGVIYAAGGVTHSGDLEDLDLLVTAIDAEGTTIWERAFGNDERQVASSLAVGSQGQLALCGTFEGRLHIGETSVLDCEASPGVACELEDYPNAFAAVFVP